MSEQLREAIQTCGLTRYRIGQATGVQQSTLSRFVHRQADLDLPTVDALAAFLGLGLVQTGRRPTVSRIKATKARRAPR